MAPRALLRGVMPRLLACIGLGIAGASCDPDAGTFSRAYRIGSMDEAIGGPVADARIGDFVLENDEVRVAIEGGRSSRLFLDVGGTLIDADLRRDEAAYRNGRGLDQLGQIAPVSNLFIAEALEDETVRITESEGGAEITAAAPARPLQDILTVLGVLVSRSYVAPGYDHAKFQIYNEYELRPGERVVRMTTTVGHDVGFCPPEPADGCNAACDDILYDDDCECPEIPGRCLVGALNPDFEILEAEPTPDGPGRGLLDILMGDLPRPLGAGRCSNDGECGAEESCVGLTTALGGTSRVCRANAGKDSGIALGDMLLLGGNLSLFLPGPGYDSQSDFHRLFARGVDTLGNPLPLDAVYGLGKGVSYGYASPAGKVLVPIFGGSFSFGATAARACTHDTPGCLGGKLVRTERWVSIGHGDAASAREALDQARGADLGVATGSVLRMGSGEPVSGAKVFALRDPRDLPCEGACADRCGAAPTAAEIDAMSVDALVEANRCRTVDSVFLEGTAALETVALTDPGPRPTREGRYRIALPAGRYVLVAVDGAFMRSPLGRVTLRGGETSRLSLGLPRSGRLEFAVLDDLGRPGPGRVTVGQCFPGDPCAGDGDCGGGDTCQAGACACARTRLLPLELGGPRLADGVLASAQTLSGAGTIELPPGDYEVLFSRGPHMAIDRASARIEAGVTTRVTGSIFRVVGTEGWSAADFHVHADPSLDSDLPMRERVTSYLAEDLDFLSSSDHDIFTRYAPLIEEMGLADVLRSQVGVEVSTQDIGHFIGWPLKYQEWKGGDRVDGNGAPDWRGLKPQEIFDELRKREDRRPVVVEVPHPYSYFDYYNLDPVTLEPSDTLLAALNERLQSVKFSGDFDTMEIINGKNADLFRRPTIGDLRAFSAGLDALRAEREAGDIDEAAYQRRVYQLHVEATRAILHRTPEEQAASLSGDGNELKCLCGGDGDCAAGFVCDVERLECTAAESVDPGDMPDEPSGAGLCRRFRGVVDDWFNMLNRGMRRPVVGGSDTHDLYGGEAGLPRTLIRDEGSTGASLDEDTVRDAVLGGRVIVTNGPVVHLEVNGHGIGDTVAAAGKPVRVRVAVDAAPWFDVDRIELYRNGELIHWVSGCASTRDGDAVDPHGHDCITSSEEGARVFEEEFDDAPDKDAWYVAIALGLDGRTLAPVYSSGLLARFGTFEVAQRIFDLIPALATFRTPRSPVLYPTFPIGITNPVWVDVDGGGWSAPNAPASWCRKGDVGCTK